MLHEYYKNYEFYLFFFRNQYFVKLFFYRKLLNYKALKSKKTGKRCNISFRFFYSNQT